MCNRYLDDDGDDLAVVASDVRFRCVSDYGLERGGDGLGWGLKERVLSYNSVQASHDAYRAT